MLGKNNNRAIYLNEFLQEQVEDIKKVDFNIFSNGETTRDVYEYEIQELNNSDFDIVGYDENLSILFCLQKVTEVDQVHSIVFDGTERVTGNVLFKSSEPLIDENGESFYPYYFTYQLKTPGSHSVTITYANGSQNTLGFYIKAIGHKEIVGIDLPIISHRDALLNVTKLWLLSSKYDRVRRPDWAGFFDDRLRRFPMTDDGALQVQEALKLAITDKIEEVEITKVTAIPHLDSRGWEVGVNSIDTTTMIHTDEATKDNNIFISVEENADFVKTN